MKSYQNNLKEAFNNVLGSEFQIDILTEDQMELQEETKEETKKSDDYEFTFETFIVGPSNKFAHAAAMAVATKPAVLYNPLCIYGNFGLGKTHLLYAICNEIEKNNNRNINIVYIKGDEFTNELIEASVGVLQRNFVKNIENLMFCWWTIFSLSQVKNLHRKNFSIHLIHYMKQKNKLY